MEVDLVKPAVVISPEEEEEEEECVTPRDRGSRIPQPTVCPPAPRKKPAVFDVKRQKRTDSSPPNKEKYSFDEAALELLFAFHMKEKKKEEEETYDVSDSDFSKS